LKFLPKKGAPDIPLELLEAQEMGRLALFCGAGISYPAGLPGFKGLVDQVYSELGATEEPLEKTAKRQ
jgi:NAD-dependent SIR2 family protein deacetylase